jgi:hypothetical protein
MAKLKGWLSTPNNIGQFATVKLGIDWVHDGHLCKELREPIHQILIDVDA